VPAPAANGAGARASPQAAGAAPGAAPPRAITDESVRPRIKVAMKARLSDQPAATVDDLASEGRAFYAHRILNQDDASSLNDAQQADILDLASTVKSAAAGTSQAQTPAAAAQPTQAQAVMAPAYAPVQLFLPVKAKHGLFHK
jgi:hypothetical protein